MPLISARDREELLFVHQADELLAPDARVEIRDCITDSLPFFVVLTVKCTMCTRRFCKSTGIMADITGPPELRLVTYRMKISLVLPHMVPRFAHAFDWLRVAEMTTKVRSLSHHHCPCPVNV